MKFSALSAKAVIALLASVTIADASLDTAAIAGDDTAVLQLNSNNYQEALEKNSLVLVEFFAPWCGYCKSLAPEFIAAANSLNETHPKVKLGQVNCVENELFCQQHGIRGYPTLKLARSVDQEPEDYEGPRDAQGIIDYVIKMSNPPVQIISDAKKFAKDIASELKPLVVQILPENAVKEVAAAVNETFVAVAHSQRRLRNHFSLESDKVISALDKLVNVDLSGDEPKYLVIHPNELDDVRLYDGEELTKESLIEWTSNAQVPAFGDINRDTYMIYMSSKLPLGYYFYNTLEEREAVADFFLKKHKELRSRLNFVALDATQFGRHAEILNMDPEIVPMFVIQDHSTGKKYGINQTEHPSPSVETIETFITKYIAGEVDPIIKSEPLPTPEDEDYDENLQKLVAHNYDNVVSDQSKDVFVMYSAPWCGHCKNVAPTVSALGGEYKVDGQASVVVAKIDHTQNDVTTPFSIEGYPTFIFYPANGGIDEKTGFRVGIPYEGKRDLDAFVEFIEKNKGNISEQKPEVDTEYESVSEVEAHDEL